MDDVILAKFESIERCVRQARRYYAMSGDVPFAEDHLRQDAVAINVQRACEQAIDLANHVIRVRKLGLPQDSRDSFRLLASSGLIASDVSDQLCRMIGFRNVLGHEYQTFDVRVMIDVVNRRLDELIAFASSMARLDDSGDTGTACV